MVKWKQGHTWQEIADSYLSYVQYLGRYSQKITVVFDGYSSSPKDHDHIRHTKNSCCDVQIRPNMMHLTPRAKFLDNTHNKSEIIHLLSSAFQKHQITVELCDNDANTSIVKAALAAAKDDSVEVSELRGWLLCCYPISYYCQVRAEDTDVLIMLIHHSSYANHPLFFTMSKGSYDVRRSKNLCLKDRGATCYFVMPLLVVILFLPLPAMGKPLYLTGFVLGTLMNTWKPSLMYRLVRMW